MKGGAVFLSLIIGVLRHSPLSTYGVYGLEGEIRAPVHLCYAPLVATLGGTG